ncbi:MAG: hypothetical protein AB8G22_09410 [Saprospiraceae bacterium]
MKILNDWKFLAIACLTLGLAPFFPEPHLFGKIRWVLGGAVGMQPTDWLDLAWHGLPWILLMRWGILKINKR